MTEASDIPRINDEAKFAEQLFEDIAKLSPDTVGVSRPAFSEIETAALNYLKSVCEAFGLVAVFDAGKNLVMSLPKDADAQEFVLVGSHVDSVPMGGNFDGLAGVVAGLICLLRARGNGERFSRPVKVIAMRGEESVWFGPCYIASKALTGVLKDAELAATHKGDLRSLADHMQAVGVDVAPVRAGKALIDMRCIIEFIELHIEQGPLLVGKDTPAAVVSSIRGNFRYKGIRCIGESGHSGAVPRAFRRDPVLAMADLLSRLDKAWLSIIKNGGDLVLTSGVVHTDPEKNALSRIPDYIDFSLDIRSRSSETLIGMSEMLSRELSEIEKHRRVRFDLGEVNTSAPAHMDNQIVAGLKETMAQAGLEPMVMASGGGHDAAVFANAGVPTAMVFVRNRNGSHNPNEAMEITDFLTGTSIIYNYLLEGRKHAS